MSKAPKCKLCGTQHWMSDPHRGVQVQMTSIAPTKRAWELHAALAAEPERDVSRERFTKMHSSDRVSKPPVKQSRETSHHCRWCPDEPLGFRSQLWDLRVRIAP